MNSFQLIEWIGFLFGLSGVWLTIQKKIWCFPVGLVNVVITAYLVFDKNLFAGTLQQIVYFILLVTGWILWSRKKTEPDGQISRLRKTDYLVLIPIYITASLLMGWLLKTYSTASLPYADSAATVLCFMAQWLIAKKKIENWILWMVANPAYILIYIIKDLPLYAVLSGIYFVMAVIGYRSWAHTLKAGTA